MIEGGAAKAGEFARFGRLSAFLFLFYAFNLEREREKERERERERERDSVGVEKIGISREGG